MSKRIWPWLCESCGKELGIVEHGRLWVRPGLLVHTELDGGLTVACDGGDTYGRHGWPCRAVRRWTPRGRRDQDASDVVSCLHAGPSGPGSAGEA